MSTPKPRPRPPAGGLSPQVTSGGAVGWAAWALVATPLFTPGLSRAVAAAWLVLLMAVAVAAVRWLRRPWMRYAVVALLAGALPLAAVDLWIWHTARQGVATLVELGQAEGWRGLQAALAASGVSVWAVGAALCLPLMVGGWAAWRWRRDEAVGWRPRPRSVAAAVVCALAAALLLDTNARWPRALVRAMVSNRHVATRSALDVEPPCVRLPAGPVPPRTTPAQPAATASPGTASPPRRAPPRTLALIVVESLRHDAVDAETMPHLAAYAATVARFPAARAAANATHPSWYTLLFSRHALWWHHLRRRAPPIGAPPLRALRDAGYRIEVYSGAGLDYYGIERQAFAGVADVVVDARTCFRQGFSTRPALDACAVDAATAALARAAVDEQRRLVVIFLDGSHFPYNWPAGERPRFSPVVSVDALRLGQVSDRVALKNRYRSGLYAVDKQLGRLLRALRAVRGAGGLAMVITGDHGEELLEHGRLSHDSELCDLQTRVPLLVEARGLAATTHPGLAAHVDVMPTLLRAAGVTAEVPVDGVPLQRGARSWAFVAHTSASSPALMAVQTAASTLELTVDDRAEAANIRALYLLRTTDPAGHTRRADLSGAKQRAAVWATHGPALAAVFGATREGVLGAASTPAGGLPPYRAELALLGRPSPGALTLRLTNRGARTWLHDVALSFHWCRSGRPQGRDPEGPRTPLPRSVRPGETVELTVALPSPPAGGPWTQVSFDLVREHVTWFGRRGSATLTVPLGGAQ